MDSLLNIVLHPFFLIGLMATLVIGYEIGQNKTRKTYSTRLQYLENAINGTKGTEVNFEQWQLGIVPQPPQDGLLQRTLNLESSRLEKATEAGFTATDAKFADFEGAIETLDKRLKIGFETAKRVDTQLNDRLTLQGNSLRTHNSKVHMTEQGLRDLDRRFTAISEALERRMRDIELRQTRMEDEVAKKTANWAKLFGPLWTTQDGFTVVAPIMSDSHLRNAIKWIEEHPQQYGRPEINEHYLAFKRELERRDNDDTWHQRLQGGPSPRQVLAHAVELEKHDPQIGKASFIPEPVDPAFLARFFGTGPITKPSKKAKRTKKAGA